MSPRRRGFGAHGAVPVEALGLLVTVAASATAYVQLPARDTFLPQTAEQAAMALAWLAVTTFFGVLAKQRLDSKGTNDPSTLLAGVREAVAELTRTMHAEQLVLARLVDHLEAHDDRTRSAVDAIGKDLASLELDNRGIQAVLGQVLSRVDRLIERKGS